MDWRVRRAMEKKVGRRVNVKGKDVTKRLTPEMTPETRDDPVREKVGGRLELISRSSVPSNAGIMKQRHAGQARWLS